MAESRAQDRRTRVVVADDHPVVRHGIQTRVDKEPDMRVVAEAANGDEVLRAVEQSHPHVVVLDARLGSDDGPLVCTRIRTAAPSVAVLMYTAFTEQALVLRSLTAGAKGYLLKAADMTELTRGIRRVARGAHVVDPQVLGTVVDALGPTLNGVGPSGSKTKSLSVRDLTILAFLAEGLYSKEIGQRLNLSSYTVDTYVEALLKYFGVSSRLALVAVAVRQGLV